MRVDLRDSLGKVGEEPAFQPGSQVAYSLTPHSSTRTLKQFHHLSLGEIHFLFYQRPQAIDLFQCRQALHNRYDSRIHFHTRRNGRLIVEHIHESLIAALPRPFAE